MKAKYYSINLNKASNRLDQFEQAQRRRKTITVVVLFVLLAVAIGAVGYKTYLVNQTIDKYRAELQSIEDRIMQLEASSDYLSPEDLFALASITRDRMIWSEKLEILGNILPKDVAFTELVYDRDLNAFMIKGISKVKAGMKDLDLVVAIINVVRAQEDFSRDFSEIKFQSSQRIKHRNQEMVRFEIACLLSS
jgi:cell division protein FtsB